MKKSIITIFMLCMTILWSCTNEEIVKFCQNIRVTATVSETRTLFSEDDGMTFVTWEVADAIGLMTESQENLEYRALNSGNTTEFEAIGESLNIMEGDSVFAYYPFVNNAFRDSIAINYATTVF